LGLRLVFPCERGTLQNIPALCETRWVQKHKSLRIFCENYNAEHAQLEYLSENSSSDVRQLSFQMKCSLESVSLLLISKYSSMLEPLTQALQATQLTLLKMQCHIKDLTDVIRSHRNNSETMFSEIFQTAQQYADAVCTNLSPPRTTQRQVHRSNVTYETSEE
ncbi:hypothetical protein, partial [Bradyrhizobium sp. 33ap4]|uniref:hypothetical protein n=1 Tax=Bradyrhizobium sp. 33ap4 TaxID=3061630 RepID=UPI0029303A12